MRIKNLVARFEDTRDLRLMGGYQAGADAELDTAIALVPRIYEALHQDMGAPPSADVFQDLASALQRVEKAPPAPTMAKLESMRAFYGNTASSRRARSRANPRILGTPANVVPGSRDTLRYARNDGMVSENRSEISRAAAPCARS
jgi:hypothetical protein